MITQPNMSQLPLLTGQVPTVCLGDSITQFGSETGTLSGAPFSSITSRNIFDSFNAQMGNPLKIVNRAGVGGNTVAQMLARFPTDVAPYKPRLVILEGMSNDLDSGMSAAQVWPSLFKIYQQCVLMGSRLLFVGTAAMRRVNTGTPVSPVDGVQYNESAEFANMESMAREASATYPGFLYCPMAVAARNYSLSSQETACGTPITGATSDGTHPLPYGAFLYATYLAANVGQAFAGTTKRLPALNGYGSFGDRAMLLQNALLSGRVAVSAPNSGFAPDNIVIAASGAIRALGCDVVARTDGGTGQKMVIPYSDAAAVGNYINVYGSGGYSGAAGIMAYMTAGIKITQTTGQVVNIIGNLQFLDASYNILAQAFFGRPHSTQPAEVLNIPSGQTADLGYLSTIPMAVPPGTANYQVSLRIYTTVGATGKVEVVDFDNRADNISTFVASFLK